MREFSIGGKIFNTINVIFLSMAAVICLAPIIHVLALSLSSKTAATAGMVGLWPVQFRLDSYEFILKRGAFQEALFVSFQRVLLGLPLNMLMTVLIAYPLSKGRQFRLRPFFVWYFVITILFNGGLIPTYMTVRATGLIDTIFALVLPCAVVVFHVVILLNFFKSLPKELEESAFADGASHWRILAQIYVPLSKPALATLILFSAVFHWNSWFDGIIYMNRPANYPLQSYLQTIIIQNTNIIGNITNPADMEILESISDRTVKASQIFIGALPIMALYPFLQKYFVKGIVLGSVKG